MLVACHFLTHKHEGKREVQDMLLRRVHGEAALFTDGGGAVGGKVEQTYCYPESRIAHMPSVCCVLV